MPRHGRYVSDEVVDLPAVFLNHRVQLVISTALEQVGLYLQNGACPAVEGGLCQNRFTPGDIGLVFYDGSFFVYAQRYYYYERDLGWLVLQPLHTLIEKFIAHEEHGYTSYKVVYAAWHQGLFTSTKATRRKSGP